MDDLDIWRSAHLLVKQHGADPILPVQLRRRKPGPMLLQNPDDLLFDAPPRFIVRLLSENRLHSQTEGISGE